MQYLAPIPMLKFLDISFCLFYSAFLYPKLHHFFHQSKWNGFIQGKLNRPFRLFVRRQFFLKRNNHRRCRIKPDVFFKSSEMHQITTVQSKRRHSICNRFHTPRRSFDDCSPQLLQNTLNIFWKQRNVFVDGFIFFECFRHRKKKLLYVDSTVFLSSPTFKLIRSDHVNDTDFIVWPRKISRFNWPRHVNRTVCHKEAT